MLNKRIQAAQITVLGADVAELELADLTLDQVRSTRIRKNDPIFRAAFALMELEFHPDALDPRSRLALWLRDTENGCHPFPFLNTAALLNVGGTDRVVGVFDGNLMPLKDWSRMNPESWTMPNQDRRESIFVVGRQATSQFLRGRIKGIGTKLFQFSVAQAREQAQSLGQTLKYIVLESEPESVGFWNKMGFRAVAGASYVQPPLEFDSRTGLPVKQVREEVLMFLPTNADAGGHMPREDFLNSTATIYTNWSLHPFRQEVEEQLASIRRKEAALVRARQQAEALVLGDIMNQVADKLPSGELELVQPE